jgi:hypothetical protein
MGQHRLHESLPRLLGAVEPRIKCSAAANLMGLPPYSSSNSSWWAGADVSELWRRDCKLPDGGPQPASGAPFIPCHIVPALPRHCRHCGGRVPPAGHPLRALQHPGRCDWQVCRVSTQMRFQVGSLTEAEGPCGWPVQNYCMQCDCLS